MFCRSLSAATLALFLACVAACNNKQPAPERPADADIVINEHCLATVPMRDGNPKSAYEWEYDKSKVSAVKTEGGLILTAPPGRYTVTRRVQPDKDSKPADWTRYTTTVLVRAAKQGKGE